MEREPQFNQSGTPDHESEPKIETGSEEERLRAASVLNLPESMGWNELGEAYFRFELAQTASPNNRPSKEELVKAKEEWAKKWNDQSFREAEYAKHGSIGEKIRKATEINESKAASPKQSPPTPDSTAADRAAKTKAYDEKQARIKAYDNELAELKEKANNGDAGAIAEMERRFGKRKNKPGDKPADAVKKDEPKAPPAPAPKPQDSADGKKPDSNKNTLNSPEIEAILKTAIGKAEADLKDGKTNKTSLEVPFELRDAMRNMLKDRFIWKDIKMDPSTGKANFTGIQRKK